MSKKERRSACGIALAEVFLVALIIGVLLAIAMPHFVKLRERVQHDKCLSNLRQIKAAKEQWALENKKTIGSPCVAADLDPYLREDVWDEGAHTTGHELICPNDPNGSNATLATSYTINNYGTDPICNQNAEHRLP